MYKRNEFVKLTLNREIVVGANASLWGNIAIKWTNTIDYAR